MLLFLIFYIIVAPICVLLHEMGHGIGAAFASKKHVHIYLGPGSEKNKENFRLGRIHFHIYWSYTGLTYWGKDFSKRQEAIALAGGPLMSLLLSFLFGLLTLFVPQSEAHSFFWWTTMLFFLQFIGTIIPMTYPRWMGGLAGYPSDGLQLLRMLNK